ncbi:MAG: STAS domain-containing protein [Gaiella sp.]
MTEFSADVEWTGDGVFLLTLTGEVDLHTAPEVRERLTEASMKRANLAVVDLSSVTFIDSMTLGVLLGANKRLRACGAQLRVVVPTDGGIRRIFEITLLDKIFLLYETRAEALSRAEA